MHSSGLYDAPGGPCAASFPLDEASPASTSISSGLCTPYDQALLSPFGVSSSTTNTLNTSMGSMTNENGAYIQLGRRLELLQHEFRREKEAHDRLK
jgi:hypothetical protein